VIIVTFIIYLRISKREIIKIIENMNEFELAKEKIDNDILIAINGVGDKYTYQQFHTLIEGDLSDETCNKITGGNGLNVNPQKQLMKKQKTNIIQIEDIIELAFF
jgi:hypothetical protein